MRAKEGEGKNGIGVLELGFLRNFKKYACSFPEATHCKSDWDWLALGRHHGWDTRLLDWTASPLVALHNATCDEKDFDKNGVVWVVNCTKIHKELPPCVKIMLGESGDPILPNSEKVGRFAETIQVFDSFCDKPFLMFFEPYSIDARIVNQYAMFSVMNGADHFVRKYLSEKLKDPRAVRRVRIPWRLKPKIRNMLDQCNITERMLYPDLDGLAAWLNRYYGPRKKSD
ncbi:MAG: FRG domain-containing protein [Planctomycetota bacterium]